MSALQPFLTGERPALAVRDALWLQARLEGRHLERRLATEAHHEAKMAKSVFQRLSLNAVIDLSIPVVLRLTGMSGIGRWYARQIEVVRREVLLERLPPEFDGFTILHLSDLHADISPGALRALPEVVRPLDYDLCVITGDFRGKTFGSCLPSLAITQKLVGTLRQPVFGVLGNHDSAGMLPGLEEGGITMLMNEGRYLVRDGAHVWLAGVDDPHFYQADDIGLAMQGASPEDCTILLSHSADNYARAAEQRVDLFLCGHTHGGQLCLPGRKPVFTSSSFPMTLASGAWEHKTMQGYTSRGIGTSSAEARLFCPPEVTLHVLRCPGR